jgi:response regulator of citrate/malate metabolism
MCKLIIIDDDPLYHFISQKMVKKHGGFEEPQCFFDGNMALSYLEQHKFDNDNLPDLIFLDLHMSLMSGWEFLDRFSDIKQQIGKNIFLHIVTSSLDPREISRSKRYPFVRSFIFKPLTNEIFDRVLSDFNLADQVYQ